MRLTVLLAFLILFLAAPPVATTEPPEQSIKRLRAQVVALRFQLKYSRRMNNQLTWIIRGLRREIDQLHSDITDCVSKIPPPVGP